MLRFHRSAGAANICKYREQTKKTVFSPVICCKLPAAMTRHCHNCGWEYTLPGLPGRTESRHRCGADLKVCVNCTRFEPRMAHQCRDRRADPVADKHLANFCEYFDFIRRTWTGKKEASGREESAREGLKKLLGD